MSRYTEDRVSPLSLRLDINNPRFITPISPTQEEARKHLLRHEDVEGIIQSIISFGGITPGERPIVCEEGGSYVVLEGNRRVCAYQLLVDPSLYPPDWPRQFTAPQATLSTLDLIPVDIVESRDIADPILTMRHLGGIKDWPTVAQYNYLAKRYQAGKSIDDLSRYSGIPKGKVKDVIGDFYLLREAIALPVWTQEELEGPLGWYKMAVTVFTRIFHTAGSMDAVGLSFNPISLMPEWEYPENRDEILKMVVKAAFIDKSINTRTKSILDVPGVGAILQTRASAQMPTEDGTDEVDNNSDPTPVQEAQTTLWNSSPPTQSRPGPLRVSTPTPTTPEVPAPTPIPKSPNFFELLTVERLDANDTDHVGLIAISREIRSLSNNAALKRTPNAIAMLLRTLIELTLKYHLSSLGDALQYNIAGDRGDPTLRQVINHYRQNLREVIPNSATQRAFSSVFNNDGIKDSLDLIVHNTSVVRATPEILRMLANTGLFRLIQDLLNLEHS